MTELKHVLDFLELELKWLATLRSDSIHESNSVMVDHWIKEANRIRTIIEMDQGMKKEVEAEK